MSTTTNPADPALGHGTDKEPTEQNKVYLVLSEQERAQGFARPVRRVYIHTACGTATRMSTPIAETYARDPKFYGSTWCTGCHMHLPVVEFTWDGTTEKVGS